MQKQYYFILINLLCFSALSGQKTYQQKIQEYQQKAQQDIINIINPIHAKVEIPTPNGLKIEIIKKTDTARIKQLKQFKESYQIVRTAYVAIDTIYPIWVKRWTTKNCCFSSDPRGCQVWCLIEQKLDTTEAIPTYQPIEKQFVKSISTTSTNCTVFPNPFINRITIRAVKNINQIIIMDNAGKIIHQEAMNRTERTINVENLPKGVYIVQVFMDNEVPTFYVTKQ